MKLKTACGSSAGDQHAPTLSSALWPTYSVWCCWSFNSFVLQLCSRPPYEGRTYCAWPKNGKRVETVWRAASPQTASCGSSEVKQSPHVSPVQLFVYITIHTWNRSHRSKLSEKCTYWVSFCIADTAASADSVKPLTQQSGLRAAGQNFLSYLRDTQRRERKDFRATQTDPFSLFSYINADITGQQAFTPTWLKQLLLLLSC